MGWQSIESAPKDGSVVFTCGGKQPWIAFGQSQKWGEAEQRWLSDFGERGWLPASPAPRWWFAPAQGTEARAVPYRIRVRLCPLWGGCNSDGIVGVRMDVGRLPQAAPRHSASPSPFRSRPYRASVDYRKGEAQCAR